MALNVVVQTLTLALEAKKAGWTDTGLLVSRGEGLRVSAAGRVRFGTSSSAFAFPEGTYPDANASGHALDLASVQQFSSGPGPENYPVSNTRPVSLAMLLLPDGQTPVFARNGVGNAIAPNREYLANPVADSTFGGAQTLRVWFLFNDQTNAYSSNSGSFSLTLERIAESSINLPPTRGGRTMSPAYASLLQEQTQHPAWCWVISPLSGQREFFTSLDVALSLGPFVGANGLNPIPAATYLPGRGVDLTAIPTSLKIETDGADVTVLNFDRLRLLGNYYFGAEVEVFEVDWANLDAGRWVAFSGRMGNAVVGDLSATVELTSWDDLLEKAGDDVVIYSCPLKFCQGMCRNAEMGDGPIQSDWTRRGVVVKSLAPTKIRVEMQPGFVTDGVRETSRYSPAQRLVAWQARLAEGQLFIFDEGSDNNNLSRQIKSVSQVAPEVLNVELRQRFVTPPLAGDLCQVFAGCTKTPERCKDYDNFANYGGWPNLPLKSGVRRF